MNCAAISQHLNERYAANLAATVAKLEAAIASGMVPNVLFNVAKETLNRVVAQSAEAFLNTGPHEAGHHQSDWWLAAYNCDAFVSGTHGLPTALKRAQKAGNLKAYEGFLTALLPLRDLLEVAKPLIRKRQDMPKVKTAKQVADEADQMTCQCCGRGIFAALGTIAHHGYERPGSGWQTASCIGAKRLPFEVDRTALSEMISFLRDRLARAETHRAEIAAETKPIVVDYESQLIGPSRYQTFRRGEWPKVKRTFAVTRRSFEAFKQGPGRNSTYYTSDFAVYKARHVEGLSQGIEDLKSHIAHEQARYDGWIPTHKRENKEWIAL